MWLMPFSILPTTPQQCTYTGALFTQMYLRTRLQLTCYSLEWSKYSIPNTYKDTNHELETWKES